MFAASACTRLVSPAVSRTRAVRRSWTRTAWSSSMSSQSPTVGAMRSPSGRRDETVAVEADADGLALGTGGQHEDRTLVGAHHTNCLDVTTPRR